MTQHITVTCSTCNGKNSGTRVLDYVRGDRTEWCQSCDGDGTKRVPMNLWGGTEIAIRTLGEAAQ